MRISIAMVALLVAYLLSPTVATRGGQSRLEKDVDRREGDMDFLCLNYFIGKKIDETAYVYFERGAVWKIETVRGRGTARSVVRTIYFSAGKPQLVVVSAYRDRDSRGNDLRSSKLEFSRRYWLDDHTAGKMGDATRRTLKAEIAAIVADYRKLAPTVRTHGPW